MTAKQKIIIDTDPGIDDAMAIHLAFAHPQLEVVGMTTIFGYVNCDQATRNAIWLAESAHYHCDVAQGAQTPLVQEPNEPSYYVHGDEGFGDLPAPQISGAPHELDAADYIIQTCRAHPNEITLCPVGPLTNIAIALQRDPELVNYVKSVVIMGGAVFVPGNVTDYAEANIWNDPHAADIVFAADWEVVVIGLDVTSQVTCDQDDYQSIYTLTNIIDGSFGMGISTDKTIQNVNCLVTTGALKKGGIGEGDYPRFAGKVINLVVFNLKKEIADFSEDGEMNVLSGMYGPDQKQKYNKNGNNLTYTNIIELAGDTEKDKVKYEYKNKIVFENKKPKLLYANIDQTGLSFNEWKLVFGCRDYDFTDEEIAKAGEIIGKPELEDIIKKLKKRKTNN